MPAALYADKVSVISPESDDALEMSDYFTLENALPDTVDFLVLNSAYAQYDKNGEPVGSGPLEADVFAELFEQYISDSEDALGKAGPRRSFDMPDPAASSTAAGVHAPGLRRCRDTPVGVVMTR